MGSSEYKERYRREMVAWGETMRNKDSEYFCRSESERASNPIWLVSDARRPSDVEYFRRVSNDKILTVRIMCPDDVRVSRGWVYTDQIDNADTECALDEYSVDMTIVNDGRDVHQYLEDIRTIVTHNRT